MFDETKRRGGGGEQRNVLGGPLGTCSHDPTTGFYRTGCCHTGPEDRGLHSVCVVLTEEFLRFSQQVGNDLSTPRREFGFPGLLPGQKWCLCAARFQQAVEARVAPRVLLGATNEATLAVVALDVLKAHAIDLQ